MPSSTKCQHTTLTFEPSPHAKEAGYQRPSARQRAAAAAVTSSRKRGGAAKSKSILPSSPGTFPAPLVLSGDDLALDPEFPGQSLSEWLHEEERNEVTPERNVVYLASPPAPDRKVAFVRAWSTPQADSREITASLAQPQAADVAEYLRAFYHGLPVRLLPASGLTFTSWETAGGTKSRSSKKAPSKTSRYIGLSTDSECTRIRTRPSRDGVFARQLNLEDLLDAAISMLPADAYALLLLVEQDLFESTDDEFVCGRAYGGSRVAVISTARYNPVLDDLQGVERAHAWPAAHCNDFVYARCWTPPRKKLKSKPKSKSKAATATAAAASSSAPSTPLQAALAAHMALETQVSTDALTTGLWLGRVCRTASHELGHCFGMDHCGYYACIMQGSASIVEDPRQPPYLCPVDLAKLLIAVGADTNAEARYRALLAFCRRHERDTHLFAAFAAWIEARLDEIRAGTDVQEEVGEEEEGERGSRSV